ncbi:hypothetical protein SDC9_149315 [bioreactor metagenome]|uniref:Uncharacterized protein n=1 Tax=bioreactor metagenome TaxID=1076179 RepID=A0A645ELE9_9ZZZZ
MFQTHSDGQPFPGKLVFAYLVVDLIDTDRHADDGDIRFSVAHSYKTIYRLKRLRPHLHVGKGLRKMRLDRVDIFFGPIIGAVYLERSAYIYPVIA